MQTKQTKAHHFGLAFTLMLFLFGCATTSTGQYQPQRPEVNAFINKMVTEHGLDRQYVTETLAEASMQPKLIESMKKPHEAKPWYVYRASFLTQKRIDGGVKFWREHEKALADAERTYGVPPHIIVGIIGVETDYGNIKGKHKVLDALATLAFDYPKRAPFFQSELENFLLMTHEQQWQPTGLLGSYAGAFGIPQFMPSSYRRYAVAYHGDRSPDIINNPSDAIMSVAHYFKGHGWRPGAPVAMRAQVTNTRRQTIDNQKLLPKVTMAQHIRQGVIPASHLPHEERAALIRLQQPTKSEYWLGLHNFYVISLYNPRVNYTMAVYQLSEAVKRAYTHST